MKIQSFMINKSVSMFLLFFAALLTGCGDSNSYKKLGFADEAEMKELASKGWKTKADYEKNKMENDAKMKNRQLAYAENCYPSTRLLAAAMVERDAEKGKDVVLFSKTLEKIIIQSIVEKGAGPEAGLAKANRLFEDYPPSKMSGDDADTPEGKELVAQFGKKSEECSRLLKEDKEFSDSFAPLIGQVRTEIDPPKAEKSAPKKFSGNDPKQIADQLQFTGVSRCIAATVIMSAGLVNDPSIKAEGPEMRNNSALMDFYATGKNYLIQAANNPAASKAVDDLVRQHSVALSNMVKSQGWDSFMPEYKNCRELAGI